MGQMITRRHGYNLLVMRKQHIFRTISLISLHQ